jgi:PBP1b-binding outer membrane lipoprotein LpoB
MIQLINYRNIGGMEIRTKLTGIILAMFVIIFIVGCSHDHDNGPSHTHEAQDNDKADNAKTATHDSID